MAVGASGPAANVQVGSVRAASERMAGLRKSGGGIGRKVSGRARMVRAMSRAGATRKVKPGLNPSAASALAARRASVLTETKCAAQARPDFAFTRRAGLWHRAPGGGIKAGSCQ